MTSTDSILQLISEIHIPGFFITVDFLQIGKAIPQGISGFLKEKYDKISHGANMTPVFTAAAVSYTHLTLPTKLEV
mgnify:CR=1 FL=1